MKRSHIFLVLIFLLVVMVLSGCSSVSDRTEAKNGDTVQVHYTGKLKDGSTFDSSVGKEPLEFTLGNGEMIPGFEKAVLGMKVGEKKTVTLPPGEAYGPSKKEMIVKIPREAFISDTPPQVGQKLQSREANGNIIVAVVTEITDTTITLDANHPLAGKDLIFEIELVKIL